MQKDVKKENRSLVFVFIFLLSYLLRWKKNQTNKHSLILMSIYSILDFQSMTVNGTAQLSGNQALQNITGTALEICSNAPLTGYFRNRK